MIERILSAPDMQLGLVLMIGTGVTEYLQCCMSASPKRVALVDPDASPSLVSDSSGKMERDIKLTRAIVSAKAEYRPYFRFNFSEVNSLHRPSKDLRNQFPGLKLLSEHVELTKGVLEVVDQFNPKKTFQNVLLLQVAGEEWAILNKLEDAGMLEYFQKVCVQVGSSKLYEGGSTLRDLQLWLERVGFCVRSEIYEIDPARPYLKVEFSFEAKRRRMLEKDVEELHSQISELERRLERTSNELEVANHEIECQVRAIGSQLERENLLKEQNADLRKKLSEIQSDFQTVESEKLAAMRELGDSRMQCDDVSAQLNSVQEERDVFEKEVQSLRERENEQLNINRSLKEENEKGKKRIMDAEAKIDAVRGQAGAGTNDVGDHAVRREILRAEAQIELIKDLLLREVDL